MKDLLEANITLLQSLPQGRIQFPIVPQDVSHIRKQKSRTEKENVVLALFCKKQLLGGKNMAGSLVEGRGLVPSKNILELMAHCQSKELIM